MTQDLRTLPKIDAHHHLWDLEHNNYPWLSKPGEPRMYGDYHAMCKNYLIDDFLSDSAPHGVVRRRLFAGRAEADVLRYRGTDISHLVEAEEVTS